MDGDNLTLLSLPLALNSDPTLSHVAHDKTRSGLVGRYLTMLDLKTSCRTLSASPAVDQDNLSGLSRASTTIMKCHESHVSGLGAILILDDSAPNLDAVSRDKKSASVRQADGPTNF